MKASLKTYGDWDRLEHTLNPVRFSKALERNVAIASRRVGIEYRKDVRDAVKEKLYDPNAPMTIAIKGSSMPLVRDRDMLLAITSKTKTPWEVVVGILRQTKRRDAKSGKERMWNVAAILHAGATVKVTQRMRAMFWRRWKNGEPGWYPLKDSTKYIVIPARPFFKEPLEANEEKYVDFWDEAAKVALVGKY